MTRIAGRLWDEFNVARAEMTPPDRALLAGYGIDPVDIDFLIGISRVRVAGGLYEPDAGGGIAYITPVLVHFPETPETPCPATAVHFGELVDLVAWHPRRPGSFALRVGSAEWLGAIEPQYLSPAPVPIRRNPLHWFHAGCNGLVLLTDPGSRHLLLTGCVGGVIAEDAAHAAQLAKIMRQPWHAPLVTIASSPRLRNAA